MTYRVWVGINKHESHWGCEEKRRRMTPICVHREKKGDTQRRRGADERQNTPRRKRRRRQHRNATGPDQSL